MSIGFELSTKTSDGVPVMNHPYMIKNIDVGCRSGTVQHISNQYIRKQEQENNIKNEYNYEIVGTDGKFKFTFSDKLEDLKDGRHNIEFYYDKSNPIYSALLTLNKWQIEVSTKNKTYAIYTSNDMTNGYKKVFDGTYYGDIRRDYWGSLKLI